MTETNAQTRQLSAKQKEILVNFVYARPEMQKGKFTPTYTKVVANALWEQVTATLNSVPGGAIKTPIQWNKTWRDLRKNVKNKISKQKKYMNGTGGGPPMTPPPPELDKNMDEKIIEILTPVAVEGNIEVPDAFIFEEKITPNVFEEVFIPFILKADLYIHNSDIRLPIHEQIVMDHDYILTNPSRDGLSAETLNVDEKRKATTSKKKYTKSSKLTDSIKNNKEFLTISQKGINATERYRARKLELLERHYEKKHDYYQKKLEALTDIKSILQVVLEKLT